MTLTPSLREDFAEPQSPEERDRFRVDSLSKAVWAMRRLRACEEQIAEVEEVAAAEYERITAWRNDAISGPQSSANYFRHLLAEYALARRADGEKSLTLPDGKVTTRAAAFKVQVTDEAAFLDWARTHHPDFIRVTEKPDLVAIKATVDIASPGVAADEPVAPTEVFDDRGESIPGVVQYRDAPTATVIPTR